MTIRLRSLAPSGLVPPCSGPTSPVEPAADRTRTLFRGYGPASDPPATGAFAGQPLRQPYRYHRQQVQWRGDRVDDRCLVGPVQVRQDPERQRLGARPGGERGDDDLVERQRELEQ